MGESDYPNTVGVTITPETIQELLKKGEVEVETDNSTVLLMYDTVPRYQSDGWTE